MTKDKLIKYTDLFNTSDDFNTYANIVFKYWDSIVPVFKYDEESNSIVSEVPAKIDDGKKKEYFTIVANIAEKPEISQDSYEVTFTLKDYTKTHDYAESDPSIGQVLFYNDKWQVIC